MFYRWDVKINTVNLKYFSSCSFLLQDLEYSFNLILLSFFSGFVVGGVFEAKSHFISQTGLKPTMYVAQTSLKLTTLLLLYLA